MSRSTNARRLAANVLLNTPRVQLRTNHRSQRRFGRWNTSSAQETARLDGSRAFRRASSFGSSSVRPGWAGARSLTACELDGCTSTTGAFTWSVEMSSSRSDLKWPPFSNSEGTRSSVTAAPRSSGVCSSVRATKSHSRSSPSRADPVRVCAFTASRLSLVATYELAKACLSPHPLGRCSISLARCLTPS